MKHLNPHYFFLFSVLKKNIKDFVMCKSRLLSLSRFHFLCLSYFLERKFSYLICNNITVEILSPQKYRIGKNFKKSSLLSYVVSVGVLGTSLKIRLSSAR